MGFEQVLTKGGPWVSQEYVPWVDLGFFYVLRVDLMFLYQRRTLGF